MNSLLALPDRIATSYREILLLLGRILIAALFVPDAYGKMMNFNGFAASLAPKGLPFPTIWAILAVVALVVGSLGVLLGYRTRLAALLLIAFVIMANLTSHQFWVVPAQAGAFWKNMALVGGLLFVFVHSAGRLAVESRSRSN